MNDADGCGATASAVAAKCRRMGGLRSVHSRLARAMAVAALASCLMQAAGAQEPNAPFVVAYTGTLKKIYDSGTVRIGYRENSPPFAFLDKTEKPIGYSLDLCEIVVEEIVTELGKDIRAQYQPVTPENRFDLVNSGGVDLECVARPWRFRRRCSSPAPNCWCGAEAGS